MAQTLRIDFVADVGCAWCAIALHSVLEAARTLGGDVKAEFYFQPFELNPDVGPKGEVALDYAVKKHRAAPEEFEAGRYATQVQASERGFDINDSPQSRIWNTRDALRLLYWAQVDGKSVPLALALYRANFTDQRSLSDHAVLLDAVKKAGLDVERARAVLQSREYDDGIRQIQESAARNQILRVPTVVFNERLALQGAQPPQLYAQTMRDALTL